MDPPVRGARRYRVKHWLTNRMGIDLARFKTASWNDG
jgi:hypothetical protein